MIIQSNSVIDKLFPKCEESFHDEIDLLNLLKLTKTFLFNQNFLISDYEYQINLSSKIAFDVDFFQCMSIFSIQSP